jgi:hypothetical protein
MLKQRLNPLLVHHVGYMYFRLEHQTFRVHQQVPFSPFYLLSSIVASVSSYSGSLYRLAIHYARTRLKISLETYSQTMVQRSV